MVRKRILVGPEVPDVETLTSLVARLGHYFAHVGVEQILVVVAADVDIDEAANVLVDFVAPAGFDPSVSDRVNRIRESIAYLPVTAELRDQAVDCDLLLVWESAAVEREPWNEIAKGYRRNRTMFDVDWRTTRGDGIWFAEAAMVLDKGFRRFDEVEACRFRDRTSRWRGAERAYLIATGPSARTALSIDLSDGVRIACNTVVLDDELMAHVAPDIVTFADPIFHFGPSTYAHAFHLALARQARRHDFTIVTVERFAGLLRSQLPQLAERIVAVRMGGSAWTQNLDLLRELAVRPYPNVLTMLMLPLAATFARDIQLIGFDGRHPDETYFWRHGETVQLGRELEEIKTVHPGFFDLDYENYYTSHVNALEQLLRRVEQQGINVSPRTPSFMTPLRRRTRTPDLDPLTSESHPPTTPPRADVILSITPDWVDRFGHFGPWERRVRRAARDSGLEYRSLASKARVPEAESELRVFTHGTLSSEPFDPALFELELREQLALVAGTGHRVYVVFYTADVWHLPSMLAVARDHPDMLFAVNLMRAHTRIAEARARQRSSGTADSDPSIRLLASCLEAAAGTNLLVCIDTEAIAAAVEEITGVGIPTWPMISVADPDQLKREKSGSRRHHHVRLVAPIQTQRGKGLSAVLALAEGMHASLRRGRVSLAARFLAQSGDTARDLEWADRLTQLGGELIEGDLTDDQYVQMISEADIVLLPYRSDIFRTRTSGVLLDAVAAGAPIVATRGTWAGDLVERFAIGATFRDGDVDHLLTAVRWTILHRRALRRRLIHQRDAILEDFAPVRMIEFLVSAGADRRGWCPTEIAVARARGAARTVVGEFWVNEHVRIQQEISDQVRADDASRAADARCDEAEALQRVSRWGLSTVAGANPTAIPVVRAPAAVGLDWCELWREAPIRLDEAQLAARIIGTSGELVVFEGDQHDDGPIALRDLEGTAHIDLLRVDAAATAMAVLEGFPWERLRPLAIVLPFDDRWSASSGHEVRDLAEQLLARGYQVWISHRHPRTNGAAGSDWQRLATYVGNPVAVGAEGRVIAFLEPVPVDVMESVLTEALMGEGMSAPEAKSKVLRFGTVAGRPDATADASRRATAVLQL